MTRANKGILHAYKIGYRISKLGHISSPRGVAIKGSTSAPQGIPYRFFSFRIEGKITRVAAHRMQAYQKYGDRLFEKGALVSFKNRNTLDCSYDNIIIISPQDVADRKPREMTKRVSTIGLKAQAEKRRILNEIKK